MQTPLLDMIIDREPPSSTEVASAVTAGAMTVGEAIGVDHPYATSLHETPAWNAEGYAYAAEAVRYVGGVDYSMAWRNQGAVMLAPRSRADGWDANNMGADAFGAWAQSRHTALLVQVQESPDRLHRYGCAPANRTWRIVLPSFCDVDGPKIPKTAPGGNLNSRWLAAAPCSDAVSVLLDGQPVGWKSSDLQTVWLAVHPFLDRHGRSTESRKDDRLEFTRRLLDAALGEIKPLNDQRIERLSVWERRADLAHSLLGGARHCAISMPTGQPGLVTPYDEWSSRRTLITEIDETRAKLAALETALADGPAPTRPQAAIAETVIESTRNLLALDGVVAAEVISDDRIEVTAGLIALPVTGAAPILCDGVEFDVRFGESGFTITGDVPNVPQGVRTGIYHDISFDEDVLPDDPVAAVAAVLAGDVKIEISSDLAELLMAPAGTPLGVQGRAGVSVGMLID